MKEKFRENVLEGIVGFLMLIYGIAVLPITPTLATGLGILLPFLFVLSIVTILYKAGDGKFDVVITLFVVLFSLLTVVSLFFFRILAVLSWLVGIASIILSPILILQAFDFIPVEEKAEVKI